ncbi:MAG: GIY-YIG nuclease family protein [Candidatus Moranbacteria bacterium]|jgi:excinuclease ABC subunit C|nr:GIY-YIG nuclease family protein [Candidatus Moranbacteria bacterium]
MIKSLQKKIAALPASPGVYIFKDNTGVVLYIGKAASLKDRVKSYFKKNLSYERPIEFVIEKINDIETQKTDTVLEAYILEQKLIKKFQPPYNVIGKDDKSFCYVSITQEDFPRFEIIRQTDLDVSRKISSSKKVYGPFTSKKSLLIALRILQKIFPYHRSSKKTEKGCLDFQIGICPGPYAGKITKKEYRKNIHAIEMVLQGKKKNLLKKLEKEMKLAAKEQLYEVAAQKRNQFFALKHIRDSALINDNQIRKNLPENAEYRSNYRIEAYDISNISGQFSVGSMVVFSGPLEDLEPEKDQYRKFKIKNIAGIDDVGMMREVLTRRSKNTHWPLPDLIILDGGRGHLNMAKKLFKELNFNIPLLAVSKGPKRKKLDLHSVDKIPKIPANKIAFLRDEAHRFAIAYHRKLREKIK